MASSHIKCFPLDSFSRISDEWQDLLSSSPADTLFLSPQWQEAWWEIFGEGKNLAGFYLTGPEGVGAVAPLARSGDTLSFVGNQDTVDYNDFMVRPGYETALYEALLASMDDQQCDSIQLASLRQDSTTLEYLPDMARNRGMSVTVEEEDVASGIALPDSWDEYLGMLSKKDRHELRRKFRRLETLPDNRWYFLEEPEQVAHRLAEFIELMKLSKPDKDEWMTSDREQFFHRMSQRMAEAGMLRLYLMEVEGRTVAASLCFDYASSRLLYNSGYNPELNHYSVGLLLNALCLKGAIEEGLDYFDFLRGPEPYKAHLGGKQHTLYQMVVSRT